MISWFFPLILRLMFNMFAKSCRGFCTMSSSWRQKSVRSMSLPFPSWDSLGFTFKWTSPGLVLSQTGHLPPLGNCCNLEFQFHCRSVTCFNLTQCQVSVDSPGRTIISETQKPLQHSPYPHPYWPTPAVCGWGRCLCGGSGSCSVLTFGRA